MTPEEGYRLASFARPGFKIVMGPTEANEVHVAPLFLQNLRGLPGDWSWEDRDLRLRLGFVPSLWAKTFASVAEALSHEVTDAEWQWLHGSASLVAARAWIAERGDE